MSVRRQREYSEIPRTPENYLVFKEKEYWKRQIHQLQQECDKTGRNLFYSEQHNKQLKDNLQQAKQLIKQKDEKIESLQRQISGLTKRLDLVRPLCQLQEEMNRGDKQNMDISLPWSDLCDLQFLQITENSLEEEVAAV